MDISGLTIGQAKEIAAMFGGSAAASTEPGIMPADGRKVIVRCRDAGVVYGRLLGYTADGSRVNLASARQMWSWTAKSGGTLIDCATVGVKSGKFSTTASSVMVFGACAIIDVAHDAVASLESASWQ